MRSGLVNAMQRRLRQVLAFLLQGGDEGIRPLPRLLSVDKADEAFEAGQQVDVLRTAHRRQLCIHEAHLSACPSLSGTGGRQGSMSMVVLQRVLHRYTRYRYRAVTLSSHFILISHLYGSCLSLSFA